MSTGGRWSLRWRTAPKVWFSERSQGSTRDRSRAMRFALDRALQQIAQFPYSGSWCGRRYADLQDMPETYRVITVSDMALFYQVLENERTILFVHMQTTTMDAPRPEMLSP